MQFGLYLFEALPFVITCLFLILELLHQILRVSENSGKFVKIAVVMFPFCSARWLDEGEDDGKIVRELRVQDEYMDDILEKRNVSVK